MKMFGKMKRWPNFVGYFLLLCFVKPCSLLPLNEAVNGADLDKDESAVIAPLEERTTPLGQYVHAENHFEGLKSSSKYGDIECEGCKVVVGVMQKLFLLNKSEELIMKAATELCIKLKIEDSRVCTGIIPEFKNEVLEVFVQVGLSPEEICGLILGPTCAKVKEDFYPDWHVKFPDVPKPPVHKVPLPKPGSPVYKILQLSDVHIDLQYSEGASTQCGEPLCCRKNDHGPGKAGYWGSYNCDIPLRTFEATLKHLKEIHGDVDMIYWTGDIPAHNVWNQSRTDQIEVLKSTIKLFIQYFPNTSVYPAVGNHESTPVNSFPPPFVHGKSSNKWLLDAFADMWSFWLPEDTMATIKRGGYYTVLHSEGFRVVSLNNNYCNNQNWWLLLNNTDAAGELQWLINVLQDAENKKEKVHILAHIPVGRTTCLKHWSWNYYKIIDRYESTVIGQFFGHTHHDHFELFYDLKEQNRTTSMAYISPSLTTYTNLNPGYRIYKVDGKYAETTSAVLDHATYILDLQQTTKENIVWKFEYSAKDSYGLKSLSPVDWDNLVTRMGKNDTLFQTYYKYKWKCSPHAPTCTTESCRTGELCDLRSGRSYDHSFCRNATLPEYDMC